MEKPRIMTPTESYVTVYPQFIKLADTQLNDCHWTSSEIEVEKDKQDMMVNASPALRHAITTGLKLFTRYEMFAGKEYWLTRVLNAFPRPEVERMASVFGMFELAVHAPFYNKLNEVLGLDTDEFYLSYVDDPVLNDRVAFLDSLVDDEDDLKSIAVFSLVEGAILFGTFALFKSCQSNGNNMAGNVVRGIDQSVVDEGLHQTGGAVLFRTAMDEMEGLAELSIDPADMASFVAYRRRLQEEVHAAARVLYEHEARIIDMLCEKGDVGTGYNAPDAKVFAKHRLNVCVTDLGFDPVFPAEEVAVNPVASWFYNGVQKFQMNDFFVGQGREYTRNWDEEGFEWPDDEDEGE